MANPAARAAFRAGVWQDMLRLYGKPGVSPLCLRLQDERSVDVPLLLVMVLADAAGLGATAGQSRTLIDGAAFWRETVVRPLRTIRRELRGLAEDPADRAFREDIKRLELDAERRHVDRIAAALAAATGSEPLAAAYLTGLGLAQVEITATLSAFHAALQANTETTVAQNPMRTQ